MAGFIHSIRDDPVIHQRGLLERRANHVAQSPLSTSDTKQTRFPFSFPSEQATTSPWVEPIPWQRPRQRDIHPQSPFRRETTMLRRRKGFTQAGEHKLKPLFHPPFPVGASDKISLGSDRTHFVANGCPVKELLTLKPVQVKTFTRKARKFLEGLGKFPDPHSTSTPSTTSSSLNKRRGPTRDTLLRLRRVSSGSFQPSLHTVGNPAPLVPTCPFVQKG